MNIPIVVGAVCLAIGFSGGFYVSSKIAEADLNEYMNASYKAYTEIVNQDNESRKKLEDEKDKIISNLLKEMDSMRDVQRSIRDTANGLLNNDNSTTSSKDQSGTADTSESLREKLRQCQSLRSGCVKLLERGSKEYTDSAVKHDALVDIVKSYQEQQ